MEENEIIALDGGGHIIGDEVVLVEKGKHGIVFSVDDAGKTKVLILDDIDLQRDTNEPKGASLVVKAKPQYRSMFEPTKMKDIVTRTFFYAQLY